MFAVYADESLRLVDLLSKPAIQKRLRIIKTTDNFNGYDMYRIYCGVMMNRDSDASEALSSAAANAADASLVTKAETKAGTTELKIPIGVIFSKTPPQKESLYEHAIFPMINDMFFKAIEQKFPDYYSEHSYKTNIGVKRVGNIRTKYQELYRELIRHLCLAHNHFLALLARCNNWTAPVVQSHPRLSSFPSLYFKIGADYYIHGALKLVFTEEGKATLDHVNLLCDAMVQVISNRDVNMSNIEHYRQSSFCVSNLEFQGLSNLADNLSPANKLKGTASEDEDSVSYHFHPFKETFQLIHAQLDLDSQSNPPSTKSKSTKKSTSGSSKSAANRTNTIRQIEEIYSNYEGNQAAKAYLGYLLETRIDLIDDPKYKQMLEQKQATKQQVSQLNQQEQAEKEQIAEAINAGLVKQLASNNPEVNAETLADAISEGKLKQLQQGYTHQHVLLRKTMLLMHQSLMKVLKMDKD